MRLRACLIEERGYMGIIGTRGKTSKEYRAERQDNSA
jgi:hypothetical protein